MSIQADFKINGVNYRLLRGGDNPSYRRRWVRARGAAKANGGSNPLRPRLTQTSWVGGSAWWKPSIEQLPDSYYTSEGMNLWRKAGQVEPWNTVQEHSLGSPGAAIHLSQMASKGADDLYMAVASDIWKWSSSGGTWADTTHNTYGSNAITCAVYDPLLDKIIMAGGSGYIMQYDGAADATLLLTPSSFPSARCSSLFIQDGHLMVYDGDTLYEVADRDTTPTQNTITDDGLGADWLTTHGTGGYYVVVAHLAVGTVEGAYYVKNVEQNGSVIPYVFRVERDAAGNWNSVPIATLPAGTVALSIGYHLGSVVIAAADSPQFAASGQSTPFPVTFYHITGGNIGVLGVPLGQDVADETPYQILGSDGPILYIAGQKRLWAYDGVRGGLHPVQSFAHEVYRWPPHCMGKAGYGSTAGYIFVPARTSTGALYNEYWNIHPAAGLATVTNFGDDLTTYVMESNYFEFGEPLEVKDLTAVSISTDQSATTQARWTIQVSIDDGSWTTIATFEDFSSGVQKQALNDAGVGTYAGYRFRYRAIYETKSSTVSIPLRAIGFEANVGQLVREWTLIIDGTESMNIENERQDPADVYDNLETLGGTEHAVQCVDYYQDYEQNGATYMATVEQLEIVREAPGEGIANVVLAEFYEGA